MQIWGRIALKVNHIHRNNAGFGPRNHFEAKRRVLKFPLVIWRGHWCEHKTIDRYDENFAGEGRRPVFSPGGSTWVKGEKQKVISRLDAALAAVLALIADQAGGAHFDLETHTKDRDWRDL